MFKNFGQIFLNGLMLVLLLGLLALPVSSIGLAGFRKSLPNNDVLSAQDQVPGALEVCPDLEEALRYQKELEQRLKLLEQELNQKESKESSSCNCPQSKITPELEQEIRK